MRGGGEKLVVAKGLMKQYRGKTVVADVSLHVDSGEIVGLLGPNGAGKTTTFYMVVGLIKPDGGYIRLRGEDITRMPMHMRARMGVGYLSQEPSVFRKMTVRQNIIAILETLGMTADEREAKAVKLMGEFGMSGLSDQKAYTLSGGERRKLEIMRALVTEPSVIMLDEPFSGVDPLAVHDIQEILKDLRRRGLGIIITDHNVRETLEVVDRAYLMYEGKVLREGASDFLVNDEMSRALYLGEKFRM